MFAFHLAPSTPWPRRPIEAPGVVCTKIWALQKSAANGTVSLSHRNLTQLENIERRESIGVEWRWPP
jgi:hypothetical protein